MEKFAASFSNSGMFSDQHTLYNLSFHHICSGSGPSSWMHSIIVSIHNLTVSEKSPVVAVAGDHKKFQGSVNKHQLC